MYASVWVIETRARNESDFGGKNLAKDLAPSTDLEIRLIDLSMSIHVGTRKMVNYDWLG
jgi:hypothetical protein